MENKYFTEKGTRQLMEELIDRLKQNVSDCEVLYRYDCYTEYITAMEEVARLADELTDLANRLE